MPESTSKRYPGELRERAVRMVAEVRGDHESEWAAMTRVAQLLGVGTPETVRKWVRQAEVDAGRDRDQRVSDRERDEQVAPAPPHQEADDGDEAEPRRRQAHGDHLARSDATEDEDAGGECRRDGDGSKHLG